MNHNFGASDLRLNEPAFVANVRYSRFYSIVSLSN